MFSLAARKTASEDSDALTLGWLGMFNYFTAGVDNTVAGVKTTTDDSGFNFQAGLGPTTSKTLSTVIATAVSYVGNRLWSFAHRVDADRSRVRFSPHLGWQDVPLGELVRAVHHTRDVDAALEKTFGFDGAELERALAVAIVGDLRFDAPTRDAVHAATAALASQPEIHAARAQLEGSHAALCLARSERIPVPSIGPMYELNETGASFYGLAFSSPVPVLNSGAALVRCGVYPDLRIGLNSFRIPDASDEFNRKHDLAKYTYLPDKRNPWKDPYWYRTEFTLPAAARERRVWLNFERDIQVAGRGGRCRTRSAGERPARPRTA